VIISRYLTKEIIGSLFGVTLVLLMIFLSNRLVRILSYAAVGKIAPNILLQLMGFEIPYLLAMLLPLGLFLGIILAYGRMYADSEMRVLHACGMGVGRLMWITSFLTLCIAGLVLVLTLWVNPWLANHKEKLITQSLSTDNILSTLMPGRFQVSPDGKRILYVERISRDHHEADNVFIADQGAKGSVDPNKSWTVLSAGAGSQMLDPATQERFMVATDGYRYEGTPGQNDFKIIQFKKYAVRMPHIGPVTKRQEQEAIPSAVLWKDYQKPENASELQWRFSIPISVVLLSLFAIPLSQVPPRRGRYSQIAPAILIYIVYMNLLFVGRNWVEQKFLPASFGIWSIHLLVLVCALGLVMLHSGFRFKHLLRRAP